MSHDQPLNGFTKEDKCEPTVEELLEYFYADGTFTEEVAVTVIIDDTCPLEQPP